MARQLSERGGRGRGVSAARFIHKFRRAAAARGPEVAATSYYSIPAIQVGQCEREEWGEVRRAYVSHTPQLVRGYPTPARAVRRSPIYCSLTCGGSSVRHTRHIVGQPPGLSQCLNASRSLCTLDYRDSTVGRLWILTSSQHSERAGDPYSLLIRRSTYHEDASPPRPTYAFKV
jgi:hypothetical protein